MDGMDAFLRSNHVLLKDFGEFVLRQSARIKERAEQFAVRHGRPFEYLISAGISKEDLARKIMDRDGITAGLICVFSCVEPCMSYAIRKDKAAQKLKLVSAERKCLHFYFYFIDREFGFMHVRLQSWFPCPIQVCINGHEWLARKLDKAGIKYERRDNCFVRIQDPKKAQQMADEMIKRNWPKLLDQFAHRFNPLVLGNSGLNLHGYYWTIREGEYSTDVVFKSASDLAAIYPQLTRHAIENFRTEDVMRFLGRRSSDCRFAGEVVSDQKKRPEGVRIKHRVEENSIKMYDKHRSVLRIETTINNPRRFKVLRRVTRKGENIWAWVPMRKGVADIYRRVEMCRGANARYLEALSVVGDQQPSHVVLDPVLTPAFRGERRYRALRPITMDEANLFRAVLGGEFLVHGFRNAQLRRLLYPQARSAQEIRRNSLRTTRLLSLLRAHGLLRKLSHTRLYRVTEKGQKVMSTALLFRQTDLALLAKSA
jgi:hypothetical protein